MWTCNLIRSRHSPALLVALSLLAAPAPHLLAQGAPPPPAAPQHATAGKLETDRGTLLRREAPGEKWQVVDSGGDLPAGDLLFGLPGAVIAGANGAVALTFQTDFDSPLPILECALSLHPSTDFDLDVTLDRGRADLINRKKEGAARVRLHAWGETWLLTLDKPGTSLVVELFGIWPRGSRFVKEPGPKDVPHAEMLFLVLKGHVDLKYADFSEHLSAPPGPALTMWDNTHGMDSSPQVLKELPSWAARAGKKRSEEEQAKYKAARERFIQVTATKGVDDAVDQLLASDEPIDRRVGVIVLGALDELKRLGENFLKTKHADVLDSSIGVLRHWMGRAPGQDQKLYRGLIDKAGYTPVQAESMLQLLHGFNDEELAQPETYELLIAYLNDSRPGIRALAHWHLIRLVPDGRDIAYDSLGDKEGHERAQREWEKLIPPGHLPPKPKPPAKPPAREK